ncbi:Ger(x)C family spore germination protein [Halobacillus naozhouensis]|uniref:Ger(X)C family spore germination protein n=1 Tax=Halobacillus naozhouensis TaxID=554880 RepID=A0ABY8IYQ4_9BACI|nr:Ger(x)C family spore germination protein [Halobacillus naozhouensis]WFT75330.1 Ger(x)C family spore germination protein [Halobacillus naozhouensis]
MRKNKPFKWTRLFQALVLLVMVLSLSGCWDADEINNLSTINLIGIDETDSGQVEVTAVIVKPHTLFSETAVAGNEQNKFLIETTTGKSILEALGNLSSTISEKVYFGHVNAIVFGERAARERMVSSLDFFKRQTGFRPSTKLLVTRGTASQLVKTMPQFNVTLGMELDDLVLSNRYATTAMVKDISQFMKALSSNTTDPITGVISAAEKQGIEIGKNEKETKKQSDTEKSEATANTIEKNQKDIPKVLSLKGTAAFKGGQLQGFLDERETRGLLWVKGELQDEIVVLSCGENNNETVTLNITNSKSKFTPELSGGTTKIGVDIQVEADIGQLTCPDFNVNTDQIDRLNQHLERVVVQDVTSVLSKAKNHWQTDIFGFGQSFYRNYPNKWEQIAPLWRNGLLKNTEVDLKVSANISRYGLLKDPIRANEGE